MQTLKRSPRINVPGIDNLLLKTVTIGVEPKKIDCGLALSPEIEEKLPEIINLALKEIEETTAMEVRNDNL